MTKPARYKLRIYCQMDAGFYPRYAASVVRNGAVAELEEAASRNSAVLLAVAKLRAARRLYGSAFASSMDAESEAQADFKRRAMGAS